MTTTLAAELDALATRAASLLPTAQASAMYVRGPARRRVPAALPRIEQAARGLAFAARRLESVAPERAKRSATRVLNRLPVVAAAVAELTTALNLIRTHAPEWAPVGAELRGLAAAFAGPLERLHAGANAAHKTALRAEASATERARECFEHVITLVRERERSAGAGGAR